MKILISGASGLVGSNCLNHFSTFPELEVVGTFFSYQAKNTVYFNTLEPENPLNLNVDEFQPDVIIHCGALTHVDYCEDHVEESYQKTVQSTANLIEIAKRHGSKFVYISTDYVFDGNNGPYLEDDKPHPISVYGEHKLEGEKLVQKAFPQHSLVLRITNVYGQEERKKNFVARMIDNTTKNEAIAFPLPYDQYATPINAMDVARALKHLLLDQKSGIYHLASTDYVNRIQLADLVLKHFPDHRVKISSAKTSELNQKAARPLLGGLITKKFLSEYPNFQFTNVDDFVQTFKASYLT